jgi:hypothetical protein
MVLTTALRIPTASIDRFQSRLPQQVGAYRNWSLQDSKLKAEDLRSNFLTFPR